jgi:hypothetical protein
VTVASFDTLKYANSLKAAGIPDKQAEAQATVLADALAFNLKELVTKDELKQSIDLLRADMNANFTLLKWMVGSLIPLVVGVLIRLLFFRIP